MSIFERLLVPGSTERPACRCGEMMEVASIERLPEGSDAAVRVYRCTACHHEMRLTVWHAEAEVAAYQEKAERAEQWLHRVYTEMPSR